MNLPKEWKTRKLRQREIKGIEATGVIIVPNTAGGELLNKLILKEAQIARVTGYMIKMVEGNGVPLSRLFPAPIPSGKCIKKDCIVCHMSENPSSKCSVRSIVYIAECQEVVNDTLTCPDSIYVGESSRSLAERANEHYLGGTRLDERNFITKHWLEHHPHSRDPPRIKFTVVRTHKDALGREVEEALLIEKANVDLTIMNSRGEWNSGSITRLTVMHSERELKKKVREIEERDLDTKKLMKALKDERNLPSFTYKLAPDTKSALISSGNHEIADQEIPLKGDIRHYLAPPNESLLNTVINAFDNYNCNCSITCYRELKRPRCECVLDTSGRKSCKRPRMFCAKAPSFAKLPYPVSASKEGVWARIAHKATNFDHTRVLCSTGALWNYRNLLDMEHDVLPDDNCTNLTQYEIGELFEKDFQDDYIECIGVEEQDCIVKVMKGLRIGETVTETEYEKSIESPLADTVWTYLKLLGDKVQDDSVGNLFRSDKYSPTTNYLSYLLQHHHLKCSFDFEKAARRELNKATGHVLHWDMSVIDAIGGFRTSNETIFLLKEHGVMKGVKRRCFAQAHSPKGSKCLNLSKLVENLSITSLPSTAQPAEDFSSQPTVLGRWSVVKLGRRSPDKPKTKQALKQTKIGGFFINKLYGTEGKANSDVVNDGNIKTDLSEVGTDVKTGVEEFTGQDLRSNVNQMRRKSDGSKVCRNLGSPSSKSRTILDFFHGKQGEQAEGRALFIKANSGVRRPVDSDGMSHNTSAEHELPDREFQLQNDQSSSEF